MRNYLLSQHFLRSPRLALMLIGHSNIKKRDVVIDIGAGSGVITAALAKKCRVVIAVEPDPKTAAKLRTNLRRQRVEVRGYREFSAREDAVKEALQGSTQESSTKEVQRSSVQEMPRNNKLTKLATVYLAEQDFLELELPDCHYKVFANPPFHLSSAIVHKLIETKNPPDSFYLILQKQFALKLLLTDRHYTSQLGQQLIRQYQTKIKYPLKPTDFTPPPAVPTVLFEAKQIPTV